jgi:hypothetical protein
MNDIYCSDLIILLLYIYISCVMFYSSLNTYIIDIFMQLQKVGCLSNDQNISHSFTALGLVIRYMFMIGLVYGV